MVDQFRFVKDTPQKCNGILYTRHVIMFIINFAMSHPCAQHC